MRTRLASTLITLVLLGNIPDAAWGQVSGCTSLTPVAQFDPGGNQVYVAVDDGWVLLADNVGMMLRVYDARDPEYPVRRGSVSLEGSIWGLTMEGSVAAASVDDDPQDADLVIYDLINPGVPRAAHRVATAHDDGVLACTISDGTLYYTTDEELVILDVGNPWAPVELGRWPFSWGTDIVVESDLAYIVTPDPRAEMWIFNVSNPASPQLLSITPVPVSLPMEIAVANNTAYVVSWLSIVMSFDVSNARSPVFLTTVASPLSIVNIAARFNALYTVETNTGGLHVYDMVDPAHPRWIASHVPPYSPWDVAVMQGMLVVADRTYGAGIFQLSDCSRCPPDLAEPTGRLDFFDVQAFLTLFMQEHRATDLDVNAIWDVHDVMLFLEEFAEGCP